MNEDVTLREIVRQEFVGVTESDTIGDTISLLADENAECAVVLHGGNAVGLVAPQDLYRAVAGGQDGVTVDEIMRDPPPALAPGDTLESAATLLIESDTPRILVTDDDGVLGLVDSRDVLAVKTARPAANPVESEVAASATTQDNYTSQSICEGCGSLSRDLSEFNGQLLCPDCRSV